MESAVAFAAALIQSKLLQPLGLALRRARFDLEKLWTNLSEVSLSQSHVDMLRQNLKEQEISKLEAQVSFFEDQLRHLRVRCRLLEEENIQLRRL